MPHHKRAAATQTSLPSISSLLCSESSALAPAHVQTHLLGRVLLHKKHVLITAGVRDISAINVTGD